MSGGLAGSTDCYPKATQLQVVQEVCWAARVPAGPVMKALRDRGVRIHSVAGQYMADEASMLQVLREQPWAQQARKTDEVMRQKTKPNLLQPSKGEIEGQRAPAGQRHKLDELRAQVGEFL